MNIKNRKDVQKKNIETRDKKVMEEYSKLDRQGKNVYSIEEVAKRNGISVPMIYKIKAKYQNK